MGRGNAVPQAQREGYASLEDTRPHIESRYSLFWRYSKNTHGISSSGTFIQGGGRSKPSLGFGGAAVGSNVGGAVTLTQCLHGQHLLSALDEFPPG